MEQEQKSKENKEKSKKEVLENSTDIDKMILCVQELEDRLLSLKDKRDKEDKSLLKENLLSFQLYIAHLSEYCDNFSYQMGEFIKSAEWSDLLSLSNKLQLLNETIEQFLGYFSGRKTINKEFLKKIDFIIMNEAIKNEMVSHIFDMLSRGESKEKLMVASLEFVYFLKEIESEETLKELKELKNLILTTQKEEANIYHFLDKLKDKIGDFSKTIDIPTKNLESIKRNIGEIKSVVEKLISDIQNKITEILDKIEGK